MNPKVPPPKYGSPYLSMPRRGGAKMLHPRSRKAAEGEDPTQQRDPQKQLLQPAPRKHTRAEGWKDTAPIREGAFEERLDGMEPPPNTITNKPGGKPAPRPTGLKSNTQRTQRNLRRAGVRRERIMEKSEFESKLIEALRKNAILGYGQTPSNVVQPPAPMAMGEDGVKKEGIVGPGMGLAMGEKPVAKDATPPMTAPPPSTLLREEDDESEEERAKKKRAKADGLEKAASGMAQNVEQADAAARSPAPETHGNAHHAQAAKHRAMAEEHRHLASKYQGHSGKAKSFQDVASHHDELAAWHERQGQGQGPKTVKAPKGDAAREAADKHMAQHLGTPTDTHKVPEHERKREVFSKRLEQLVQQHFGDQRSAQPKVETPKHQQHSSNEEDEIKLPKKSKMSEKKIAAAGTPPPPKKD